MTIVALLALTIGEIAMSAPKFESAPREFRAAWVATVDNIDWPSKKDLSTAKQKEELLAIIRKAEQVGLNALIFQIRPSCDSMYPSPLEPWSEFLTGEQGKAPSPNWDPLAFAIRECHNRGIELHAWFNPYRAKHFKATGPLASNHVRITKPQATKSYGRYLWMDPGEPETPKQTLDVMLDVIRRYDLDGVHMDDYFYPYEEKDSAGNGIRFPDQESYSRYRSSGGTLSLSDWRRKNVDDFVQNLYKNVKEVKPWVKVGISPFGIYRPNHPEGVKSGIDQFDHPLYADCRKWFVEGWCDYFTPQLYWKIDSPGQPYEKLLKWWDEQNPKGRHLWPGNYTGRLSSSNGDWAMAEVAKQIEITRKVVDQPGNVHFSFKVFMENDKNINEEFAKKLYKSKALVPASPWLGSAKPPVPTVEHSKNGNEVRLAWKPSSASSVRQWAIYVNQGGKWRLSEVAGADLQDLHWDLGENPADEIAVCAISPSGMESDPFIVRIKK